MVEVEAAPNVVVRAPDDVEVHVVSDGPARRGVRRGAQSTAPATSALKESLQSAEFSIVAEVQLVPTRPGTRALRRDRDVAAEIEIKVGPRESALVLLEATGGVYAWSYPREDDSGRAGRRAAGQRTLRFSMAAGQPARGMRGRAAARRGIVLDWIADKLVEPVRAYVLKFAVNAVIDTGVDYLEGDKPLGLICLRGDDPAAWRPGATPIPKLPKDHPARILLLVHGTFSSTAGGFGHLVATDAGRAFLVIARKTYDIILGFDHKTLAADPLVNAELLVQALAAIGLPQGSTIDAIAHSRGGLVYRAFAEKLLETRLPDVKLGKAIFVGCTNAGTHLAEPENWEAMVDLYTNAFLAGARAVVTVVGGAALSPLLSTGVKTIGRFVQMLSEVAINENRVPGLAAMQPTSAVVAGLNGAEGGLERLATYYAITSNFVARVEPKNGITKELAEFLVDRITNRLFKVDNDLVVDTASMTSLGSRSARLELGGTFAFGNTEDVYHTIYFAAERVPSQMAEWLGFGAAAMRDQIDQIRMFRQQSNPEELTRGEFPETSRAESINPEPNEESMPPLGGSLEATEDDAPVRTRSGISGTRGVTRRLLPAGKPKSASAPALQVPCHFAAEMDQYPALKQRIPLFVTVSRETIEAADHAAAAATKEPTNVDTARKIVIEVIARKNCKVFGESVVEIDVPSEKRPETLRFTLEGTEQGAGDLLVEARQGARILVSFKLAPIFVDAESRKLTVGQSVSAAVEGPEEPAVLRIYEIVEGGRVTLRFDLTCFEPNISVSESRSLPAGFSRDAYVTEIFKDIETAWLATSRTYDQFLLRLKANGIRMANELLPDKVRDALWSHRDAIRAIQVISEEPFIPWELIYVTNPKAGPDGKGFLSEWGLVRWLHNTNWPGRRLALNKDRVFYVIPSYLDPSLQLMGAAEERKMLTKLFGSPQPVKADSLEVSKFLQMDADGCDVLHFACHGEAAQRAVMRADLLMTGAKVDNGFILDSLSADVVKAHARFAAQGPKPIIFINACQTGRGGAGLSAGVAGFVDAFLRPYSESGAGALIGALWSVDDRLAFTFAMEFYSALLNGKTLVDAARQARVACQGQKDLTWLAYTVYGDPFARVT
jgi:hypothetical protein